MVATPIMTVNKISFVRTVIVLHVLAIPTAALAPFVRRANVTILAQIMRIVHSVNAAVLTNASKVVMPVVTVKTENIVVSTNVSKVAKIIMIAHSDNVASLTNASKVVIPRTTVQQV